MYFCSLNSSSNNDSSLQHIYSVFLPGHCFRFKKHDLLQRNTRGTQIFLRTLSRRTCSLSPWRQCLHLTGSACCPPTMWRERTQLENVLLRQVIIFALPVASVLTLTVSEAPGSIRVPFAPALTCRGCWCSREPRDRLRIGALGSMPGSTEWQRVGFSRVLQLHSLDSRAMNACLTRLQCSGAGFSPVSRMEVLVPVPQTGGRGRPCPRPRGPVAGQTTRQLLDPHPGVLPAYAAPPSHLPVFSICGHLHFTSSDGQSSRCTN